MLDRPETFRTGLLIRALTIATTLAALSFGCTVVPPKSDYLDVDDFIPHIVYTWKNKKDKSVTYYIADPSKFELILRRGSDPIAYVGTVDSYHLFRVVPKRPIARDELLNFAVLKDYCIVEDPKKPDEESVGKGDGPRWIDMRDGKIIVKKLRP
jgi:hypothetical protein